MCEDYFLYYFFVNLVMMTYRTSFHIRIFWNLGVHLYGLAYKFKLTSNQLCAVKVRTYAHVFIVATSILSFTSSIGV